MYRQCIRDIIVNIRPLDELERDHQRDALDWIDSGVELCRLQRPATPPKHLVSYVLLLDIVKQTLLLVDHKKCTLWIPPGGHVDPEEHPADAASRELYEELTIRAPLLQPDPLFLTVTPTTGATAGHIDVSLWYLFEANSSIDHLEDFEEFTAVQWFPLSQLPLDRSDPHLGRCREKVLARLSC